MRHRVNKIFFIGLILSAAISLGLGIEFSGGNTIEYWLYMNSALDSLSFKDHFEDRLKLNLNYEKLRIGTVFFYWHLSAPNQNRLLYFDYNCDYTDQIFELTYGRYYVTFGKGLCLNQYLDEDFRVDNSIFGFKGVLKYQGSELTFLAGEPRNIFFEENIYKIKNDTLDRLRGINLDSRLRLLNTVNMNLGARYVRYHRPVDITPRAFTELFGGNIEVNLGPYEGYLEYAQHLGSYPYIGGRLTGNALFFSSALTIPGLGINFQLMNYDSIGFGGAGYRYNEVPTPIKSGTSINRGIDEFGYGLGLVCSLLDKLNIDLQHNTINSHNKNEVILEQIGNFKYLFFDNLEGRLNFEHNQKNNIELPIKKKTEFKPTCEFSYTLENYFIDFSYEHNFISADSSKYYEHAVVFSLGRAERAQFTLRLERRNRTPIWLIPKIGDERYWILAELSWDISDRHNLRVRVGSEKGGIICSGGVCRYEEPFRGIKLVLTSIF